MSDLPTDNQKQKPKGHEGPVTEFFDSALYAAVQEPLKGVSQLVDHVAGTNLEEKVTFMSKPEGGSGTGDWMAQQLGGAAGMLVPFMLVKSGLRGVLGGSIKGTEGVASLGLSLKEAGLTGFAYDSVLKPTDANASNNFWVARGLSGVSGAATFMTLTGSAYGLGKLSNLAESERIIGSATVVPLLRNQISAGMLSGVPAGLVSAEGSALANNSKLASRREIEQSIAGMAFIGGVFGANEVVKAKYTDGQSIPKFIAGKITDAWTSGGDRPTMLAGGDIVGPEGARFSVEPAQPAAKRREAPPVESQPARTNWKGQDLYYHLWRLPEEERLTEFTKELSSASPGAAAVAVHLLPPDPLVLKTILDPLVLKSVNPLWLLQEFSLHHLYEQPVESGKTVVSTLFDEKIRPQIVNGELEKKWWQQMLEPERSLLERTYNTAESVNRTPAPVKDFIVNELPPSQLARILFENKDSITGERLAERYPETVREIARYVANLYSQGPMPSITAASSEFLRSQSLTAAVEKAASIPPDIDSGDPYAVAKMLASLAGYTSKTGSETVHDLIDLSVSASKSGLDNTVSTALTTAVQVIENQAGAANLKTDLVDPLLDLIKDEQLPFESRLLLAGSLGRLERDGFIPSELVEMPNLRMQEVAGLSDKEKTALRETAEAGLFEPTSLHELMGDGPLGKLFPAVFGKHSEGGIVGRPQHGGHEFPLDAHILKVVEKTANHPKFTSLSRKDQINLLWASLFHDVAKRPNMIDEGHDERSSMVSWGVLKTLGYPQQRIQRIANLVERHGEVSYQPPGTEQAWQDGLDDLAAGTRHPSSTLQMRILNESDIASIDSSGSYLTDAVRVQLANQSNRLESRSNQLSVNSLPLLTTQVPHRFGIFEMSKPYALLAHVSDHINTTFLKQLPSLESRTFSASTTVITDKFRALASTKSPSMVAILEGPAENISQAYPENLATGRFVDWKGHVNLVKDWTNADKAEELATRVDTKLKSLGFGNSAPLSALAEVRGKLAQFDTADELTDSKTDARLLQAHNIIISALTTSHGEPLRYSNEAKINNPSVSAIGIFSQGKPVVLDGAPSGLTSSSVPIHQDDSLVIPKAVWQEAQRRNLPFLILDPSDCIETSPHPDRY